ncbi:MAG: diacylglycerol kinase family protein, partial [Nitrospirota bacterium]
IGQGFCDSKNMSIQKVNRVLIVANPVAGRGKAVVILPHLLKAFAEFGITPETYFTTANPHDDLLDQAILNSDAVIAMGGDGTLNRVSRPIILNAKPNTILPMVGLIPMGTGNVASGALCFPRSFSETAHAVVSEKKRLIDVGVVFQNDAAIAVFLLWLGAGLDGAVIHAVAAIRSRYLGSWLIPRYVIETLRTFATYSFPNINIVSGQIHGDFPSAVVANIGSFGVGGVTRKADPTDGKFNLIATSHRNRFSWCLSGLMAGLNCYDFCWDVNRSFETDIKISAGESVPVQIDGEPFCSPPFSIQIRKAALPILSV